MTQNKKIESFQDLKIWQRSIGLVGQIYKMTTKYPNDEKFGIVSQIRRSAVSIPSNIAEGFGRWGNKEFRHFLYVSMGSCAELITQLVISSNLGYINKLEMNKLIDEINQISKMITALIKKIEENLCNDN
jgi:four helix bundle protein